MARAGGKQAPDDVSGADGAEAALRQERAYIAHELHDSLAQTLVSVRYAIRNLDHAIQGGDECEIYEIMELLENNVEIANRELRELITRFRAPLDELRLASALKNQVEKFAEESGVEAVFQDRLGDFDADPLVVTQVIRIVQEALANVRRHARAGRVRVILGGGDGRARVRVQDDGAGFDVDSAARDADGHFGLAVMRERAARIGGELGIESEPGGGARVLLTFPASRGRARES